MPRLMLCQSRSAFGYGPLCIVSRERRVRLFQFRTIQVEAAIKVKAKLHPKMRGAIDFDNGEYLEAALGQHAWTHN